MTKYKLSFAKALNELLGKLPIKDENIKIGDVWQRLEIEFETTRPLTTLEMQKAKALNLADIVELIQI
jgi:hypothetical protein